MQCKDAVKLEPSLLLGPYMPRHLTALPVFNEVSHVDGVLDRVSQYSGDILVIDDGSTDGTAEVLAKRTDIQVVRHDGNKGYGAALKSAFCFARRNEYDVLVTIDCDGQHEPMRIPRFVDACQQVDMVSGSRYLKTYEGDSEPPAQRKFVNKTITREINRRFGFELTDAFCGFKAYRVESLAGLDLAEDGYAMPLELWVQAAALDWKVIELPVPLIYLDEKRSFGGNLDDAAVRLQHYQDVLDSSEMRIRERPEFGSPAAADRHCRENVG
jgi:glycosyltransferase involved in cell wall biosynthesis